MLRILAIVRHSFYFFTSTAGEQIKVSGIDSSNSNLRNRLINSLFGFYLIYCTILVIARQLFSHSNELNYTITPVDIGWFSLLIVIYMAGLISALALKSPKSKYLIKSFAILLTTIIASLWGAYVFGLETSTNILITYSSITLVIVGYYYAAQTLLVIIYSAQMSIFVYSGDLTYSSFLLNELLSISTFPTEDLDRSTIIQLLAHIIGPASLGFILNYAINAFIQSIERLNSDAVNDIERLNDKNSRDSLTGLKGRQGLVEEIQELRTIAIEKDLELLFLFHDLDNIKSINQQYGYIAGDQVILNFSQTIKENITWDARFYRLGGDEFISLHIVDRKSSALIYYLRELGAVKHISHGVSRIQYKANVGAYNAIEDEPISMLIAKADNARRRAKMAGMNSFQELSLTHHLGEHDEDNSYSDIEGNLNAETVNGQISEKNIKEAILNNEFIFYGQPIINCQTNQVIGVEAGVQWLDLENKIIPIENYYETFRKLEWEDPYFQIIHNARKDFIWSLNESSYTPVHFSIDATSSIDQLISSGIIDDELFSDVKLLENCVFAITQLKANSPKIKETDKFNNILKRSPSSGLKIALDNFGSGKDDFSSLADFNIDILKIDKEIIRGIEKSAKKQEICKSLVNLCNNLSIELFAKGVENSAQSEVLRNMGIFIQQGLFWHQPMTVAELKNL